jgi:RNase H-fold protein (predicted Holliday junction resolvase)
MTHRSIKKVNLTAKATQLVQHNHLLDIVVGKPIRFRDDDTVHSSRTHHITKVIQVRSILIDPTAPMNRGKYVPAPAANHTRSVMIHLG